MPPDCKIHWTKSNVSRVSDDFYPGRSELARHQITQCTYNSLWYSVFCWPDHDMFQTNSPKWNPLILLHMVSGGPLYIADELGETKGDVVAHLCFPDGRLPRLDRPAIPTNDIIFSDSTANSLCKMWNYHDLPGWGRIYYYYFANMVKNPQVLTAKLQMSDFGGFRTEGLTNENIQNLPTEYVVKDQDSGFTTTIRTTDGSINIKINHMEAKYFSFHPIQRDVSLIGLAEIYNGSKGIAYTEWCGQTALMVTMAYQGTLLVYKRTEGILSATTAEGTPLLVDRHPENPRLFGIQVPKGAVLLRWI
jgi:hypothetical protein